MSVFGSAGRNKDIPMKIYLSMQQNISNSFNENKKKKNTEYLTKDNTRKMTQQDNNNFLFIFLIAALVADLFVCSFVSFIFFFATKKRGK